MEPLQTQQADQTEEELLRAMDRESLERLLYALLPMIKLNE